MDGIIFDVDGTLWDSTEAVARSWNQAIEENTDFSLSLTADRLKSLFGKTMDENTLALFPSCPTEERDRIGYLCFNYENRLLETDHGVLYPVYLSAEAKDFKVIIAGAGMAAHLPGMCAAIFPMPVIGIPMSGKNLEGVDALYSIVQMPPGIPVATVAIDGGANAAILAAKILATSDPELLQKLKDYTAEMKETVQKKAEKLEKIGHKEYIKQM